MADHRLPQQAWNIGCMVQNTNMSKILSSGWVIDKFGIMKWINRWEVKDPTTHHPTMYSLWFAYTLFPLDYDAFYSMHEL